MADFDTSHVKNIVLLGHAGAGKTSLAECMLFEAGLITRKGSVNERNTVSDYHELEKERGNSVFCRGFLKFKPWVMVISVEINFFGYFHYENHSLKSNFLVT